MYYIPPSRNHNKNIKKNKSHRRGVVAPDGWKEPTKSMRMSYHEWLQHVNDTKQKQLQKQQHDNGVKNIVEDENIIIGPNEPHWYYRLIGCGGMGNDGSCDKDSSEYLYDEMPFFQPNESLYVVEPTEQKGIHCRFGMDGVIAENHFDGSRNSIVLLKGQRRYILTNPNQCQYLTLYPIIFNSFIFLKLTIL